MTYAELQDALTRMDMTVDAAEAHGWLCGALCAREDYDAGEWLAGLAADREAPPPVPDAALRLFPGQALEALRSPDFKFEPLLPGDDAPLADRVARLAAWCDGFLYGIGTAAPQAATEQSGEVGEFLRSLSEIARAELEPGRDAESGEGDFFELVEFVRAGAQLAFDELAGSRADAAG